MIAYLGEAAKLAAVRLVEDLRAARISTLQAFGDRSLKSQLKSANRGGVAYTIILGEEELKTGQAAVREMAGSQQIEVPLTDLVEWLRVRLDGKAQTKDEPGS